jgi:hypothetical protein
MSLLPGKVKKSRFLHQLDWMKTNAELGFWHDWRADCPSSAVLDGHSFQGGEAVERFKPFLTAMATGFDAAKGQLYTATGAIVVDKYLPAAQVFGHTKLPGAVLGPDPGDQAKGGGVGQFHSVGFVLEGHGA